MFQLLVNGDPVGRVVDCYRAGAEAHMVIPLGPVTILKPGNICFRFRVMGRNPAANGSELALQRITLTPSDGFTLLSPNGACLADGKVLLRWKVWPEARRYRVEMDGSSATTVKAPATAWQTAPLAPGVHRWRVIAVGDDDDSQSSNFLSFTVGAPQPYSCREFSDDLGSSPPGQWACKSMLLSSAGGSRGFEANGLGSAVRQAIRLGKTEGELSAQTEPGATDSVWGVGFQSDDGTQLCAVIDLVRHQLRLERRLQGPTRYSIFDVTPKAYQMASWAERTEGDAIVWEIAAKTVSLSPGTACQLKLTYSRRSGCVMATLVPSDGSPVVTLRGLTDLRTPDQPLLVSLAGRTTFQRVSFRLLNTRVYKWDPDSIRIVLRPGAPGSWDAEGAFNPAVLVRNGTWFMVYRGNARPAPPNGPIGSELGLATSHDGIHWVKNPANPIIRKVNGKGAAEDPDLIWPRDSAQVYLEYVSFNLDIPNAAPTEGKDAPEKNVRAEVMRSSTDFVHWSDPWILNSGKTWGKMAGFIDSRNEPALPAIQTGGAGYRYISMIEEGRIDLSNDLHQWIKAGTADLKGTADSWGDTHECSGDIFVDHDRNIRFESQMGVKPESGKGAGIVGNPLCTVGEGVLSGSDPTKVLWRSDLPWLTDWYGDAPTGAPEDFTATNGSVFPGQTIIRDGWLWHFCGGNNHCTLLSKCWYGPLFECRDLQATLDPTGQCSVRVTVRNVGSLDGTQGITLAVDGKSVGKRRPNLERDTEMPLEWKVPVPAGLHTLSVDDLSITLKR